MEPTGSVHFGNQNFIARIDTEGGHFGSHANDVNLFNSMQEYAWLDFLMLNPSADLGEAQREWESRMRKQKL